MGQVKIYDTTLRDGAAREGISFSVDDKLKIAHKLADLGIHYIEGGWPGSNPKDAEFFQRANDLGLYHSTLVAFGSTRRPGATVESDANVHALIDAGTRVVTLVGKTWDLHVHRVLETSLEENLLMIADTIRYLKGHGIEVFFDAEHFFDGFKANKEYALQAIGAAAEAGADCLILCDTNGGSIPSQVGDVCTIVNERLLVPFGIHAHNDSELAVANSLAAVASGAIQVQGTVNGYGERCGNANLCSVIPNLKLKMGIDCIDHEHLTRLTEVAHYVSEIANLSHDTHQPYTGTSAFAHKAGIHVAAMMKAEESYQHIAPELVGNLKRVVVSELSGRGNIVYKARELGIEINPDSDKARKILAHLKAMENQGFQYEGAEASFELLVRRSQVDYTPPFEIVDFLVVVETRRRAPAAGNGEQTLSEATVKVRVGDKIMHTAAEGNGPVNALDAALRKALVEFYPRLEIIRLVDYKVRVIDETDGTEAFVRVLIESTDGEHRWSTVGSSPNIIEASWMALTDSLEYWLLRKELNGNLIY